MASNDYKPPKLDGSRWYTLDDQNRPVQEPEVLKWAQWCEHNDRRIAFDTISDVTISTVFLGIGHNFMNDSPILWETMVFGGEFDQEQERYMCHEDALNGHNRWLHRVRGLRVI